MLVDLGLGAGFALRYSEFSAESKQGKLFTLSTLFRVTFLLADPKNAAILGLQAGENPG